MKECGGPACKQTVLELQGHSYELNVAAHSPTALHQIANDGGSGLTLYREPSCCALLWYGLVPQAAFDWPTCPRVRAEEVDPITNATGIAADLQQQPSATGISQGAQRGSANADSTAKTVDTAPGPIDASSEGSAPQQAEVQAAARPAYKHDNRNDAAAAGPIYYGTGTVLTGTVRITFTDESGKETVEVSHFFWLAGDASIGPERRQQAANVPACLHCCAFHCPPVVLPACRFCWFSPHACLPLPAPARTWMCLALSSNASQLFFTHTGTRPV